MSTGKKRKSYGAEASTIAISHSIQKSGTGDTNVIPKSPTSAKTGKPVSLRKEFGIIGGIGLIFGNIIGSGIFVTTSTILGYTQSFGLTLITWVVGGLIAMIGTLCYIELGTMIQKSGSEYAYILEAYSFGGKNKYLRIIGRMLAFTNVWYDLLVGNPASMAIPLLTFGRYACRPFFIGCPDLPDLPIKFIALSGLSKYCISLLYMLLCGYLCIASDQVICLCVYLCM